MQKTLDMTFDLRGRRTFVELLVGCMLNPEGWVTRAIGAICREAHWSTYYNKLIERAHVSVWASFPLMDSAPWRKGAMITAGLFSQWLRFQFIGIRVRDACHPKPGNFVMPFPVRISVCSVEARGIVAVSVKSSHSCVCHHSPPDIFRQARSGVCLNFS